MLIQLIRRVNWLKNEIDIKGGQTAEGQSSTVEIVERLFLIHTEH
jgi:hypothetical protein